MQCVTFMLALCMCVHEYCSPHLIWSHSSLMVSCGPSRKDDIMETWLSKEDRTDTAR